MDAIVIHLRVYWKFWAVGVFCYSVKHFWPGFFQGAASETGQDVYGWVTWFNSWMLDVFALIKNLSS